MLKEAWKFLYLQLLFKYLEVIVQDLAEAEDMMASAWMLGGPRIPLDLC